jgi:hypothetical protein
MKPRSAPAPALLSSNTRERQQKAKEKKKEKKEGKQNGGRGLSYTRGGMREVSRGAEGRESAPEPPSVPPATAAPALLGKSKAQRRNRPRDAPTRKNNRT